MEDLGLKIQVVSFLTGMGDREELGDLVLAIIECRFKVPDCLRFDTADKPDNRRFHLDTDIPYVNGGIPPEPADKVGQEFPGVRGMRCSTDTGSDKHGPGLLSRHGYTAGAPLRIGQVAFPIRAEATEVAERQVKGFVPGKEGMVPRTEGREGRERGWSHGLMPAFLVYGPDGDTDIPEVCDIRV